MNRTRRTVGLLLATLFVALSSSPLAPAARAVGPTTWRVAHGDEALNYTEGSACADPDFWTDGSWSAGGSGAGAYDSDEDAIQDAIDNASSGDTVVVCFGHYNFDTDLHNFDAGMNLTIAGDGIGETVFDGVDSTRLINSNPNGEDDDGGTLTVQDISLQNASVAAFDNGGAINADGLTLMRVSITNSAGAYNGGALYAEGSVSIIDSTFEDNHAGSDGGVLYAWGSSLTEIINSEFIANDAGWVAGAVVTNGTTRVEGSHFERNSSVDHAGALQVAAPSAIVEITNSVFTQNDSGTFGGALVLHNLALLHISGSTFSENVSHNAFGGAIQMNLNDEVIIEGSTFNGNEALGGDTGGTGNGGAIDGCDLGSFTSTRSRYINNVSTQFGGAVGLFGLTCASPGSVTLVSNQFVGNAATDDGGALWLSGTLDTMRANLFSGNSSGGVGGAVYGGYAHDGGSILIGRIEQNVFLNNYAEYSGGAVWLPGDAVSIRRNTFKQNTTDGDGGAITFSELTRRGLRAVSGNVITRNSATMRGGAVALYCSSLSRSTMRPLVAANRVNGNRAFADRRTAIIAVFTIC